jgi:hypothetical protein
MQFKGMLVVRKHKSSNPHVIAFINKRHPKLSEYSREHVT